MSEATSNPIEARRALLIAGISARLASLSTEELERLAQAAGLAAAAAADRESAPPAGRAAVAVLVKLNRKEMDRRCRLLALAAPAGPFPYQERGVCQLCGKMSNSRDALRRHLKQRHAEAIAAMPLERFE